MNKLSLLGLNKEKHKLIFRFKKTRNFFKVFPELLDSLKLDKTASFYQFDEEDIFLEEHGLSTFKAEKGSKIEIEDLLETTKNDKYELDIFYGKNDIIIVIRSSSVAEKRLTEELLKIAKFKE